MRRGVFMRDGVPYGGLYHIPEGWRIVHYYAMAFGFGILLKKEDGGDE